jgi:hypothetical protein
MRHPTKGGKDWFDRLRCGKWPVLNAAVAGFQSKAKAQDPDRQAA